MISSIAESENHQEGQYEGDSQVDKGLLEDNAHDCPASGSVAASYSDAPGSAYEGGDDYHDVVHHGCEDQGRCHHSQQEVGPADTLRGGMCAGKWCKGKMQLEARLLQFLDGKVAVLHVPYGLVKGGGVCTGIEHHAADIPVIAYPVLSGAEVAAHHPE